MKPTLLVLAAGMGSRYGSLKQMDPIGPGGEAIIDYTVFDAIRGGFGKVVFVIRKDFGDDFRSIFNYDRFGGKISVEYVYQMLDSLPEGFEVPAGREKPWGTNHAVMMGMSTVVEPFAVVNADDFYGADPILQMGNFLAGHAASVDDYAMVGYQVCNTLSENGTVSRGVCSVDADGYLVSMVERTKIERQGDQIVYIDNDGTHPLVEDTPVSMNLFGFTPDYFNHSNEYFKEFLRASQGDPKAEYYIPLVVNKLVSSGAARMKVLRTGSDWFGVTYKEDRPATVAKVRELIDQGVYPENLWKRN